MSVAICQVLGVGAAGPDRHLGLGRGHDADAADRALDRIEQNCARLRLHSKLGPTRPDIAIGARVLIIDRWLAFYRLTEDGVQIVRIVDGARDQRRLEWPIDEGTM